MIPSEYTEEDAVSYRSPVRNVLERTIDLVGVLDGAVVPPARKGLGCDVEGSSDACEHKVSVQSLQKIESNEPEVRSTSSIEESTLRKTSAGSASP